VAQIAGAWFVLLGYRSLHGMTEFGAPMAQSDMETVHCQKIIAEGFTALVNFYPDTTGGQGIAQRIFCSLSD
jgi:hypothetical protein